MVRVLHIVGSLEKGGIETFLMNLYRKIDRSKVQFDFAIYNKPTEIGYAREVRELGGEIYLIPKKSESLVGHFVVLKRVIKENGYDYVWRSTDSCIGGADLIIAFLAGAKHRVLHAHSSNIFGISKLIHYLLRPFVNMVATKRFACGAIPGKWMFGNREYEIIPNGIDTDKFKFSEDVRNKIRQEHGVGDAVVLGNVGRLEEVKNPLFLIDVFYEFHKKVSDSVLFFIGTGNQENICKEKAEKLGIKESVFFLGSRSDVADLLQMIDVFVMPSLYEGFPVAMIEAQDSGLPCVVADTVPKETNLLGHVSFISLNAGFDKWADAIHSKIGIRDKDAHQVLYNKGYDMKNVVENIVKHIIEGN